MSSIFFGIPKGITEGQCFDSRMALVEAGLHRSPQRGIDGNKNDGTAAIVLSGGYEDDKDYGDEIIYTGEGGNERGKGIQNSDQSWESLGNKGLLISEKRKLPVRVIRGSNHNSPYSPKQGYQFAGLFFVSRSWEETGRSGFKICRFELIKEDHTIPDTIKEHCLVLLGSEGKESQWYGIGTEGPKARKISIESNMAKSLLGRRIGDIIDFGNGFKVEEIKKYKSH